MDKRVLIADDDKSVVWVLERFFGDKGFTVETTGDGIRALKLLKDSPPTIALIDINMPEKDGLTVLKEAGSGVPVIIMTAETTMKNTIEAMKLGAFDYVTKPFDMDELELTVDRVLDNLKLREEVTTLKERLKEKWADETVFVGRSRAIQKVFKTIGKVAPNDVPVLVLGESGTGKELASKLIHLNSPRSGGPFVALNSAAVPRELMESELFGHEKGAFTGATAARKGKFELADGGTLFLDEIGDMETSLQAKLLRALQDGEFHRVGGSASVKVNVRIISATHQELEKMVVAKRFREDLLFRINVVTITIPPLRDRKSDIAPLAEYFLQRFTIGTENEPRRLSKGAMRELEAYHWPGNVRELENVLRRAVLLSPSLVLTPDELALPRTIARRESIEDVITQKLEPFIEKTSSSSIRGPQELYDSVMPFMERPLIKLVLKKTRLNQVKAAEMLGINRNTLRKKIKELKISIKDMKE